MLLIVKIYTQYNTKLRSQRFNTIYIQIQYIHLYNCTKLPVQCEIYINYSRRWISWFLNRLSTVIYFYFVVTSFLPLPSSVIQISNSEMYRVSKKQWPSSRIWTDLVKITSRVYIDFFFEFLTLRIENRLFGSLLSTLDNFWRKLRYLK